MTREEKLQVFDRELSLLTTPLRTFVETILERTGDWFYHDPASTSGKHHPQFALGDGGLVRHTKAVVYFVAQLCNTQMFGITPGDYRFQMMVAAAILHDIRKHTAEGGYVENHAREACVLIMKTQHEFPNLIASGEASIIAQAIASHMGIWGIPQGERKPETDEEKLLHMADYLASRRELDLNIF
jgi:23S rRNA maturation-related 3'-5' exoribonuclease YhaM